MPETVRFWFDRADDGTLAGSSLRDFAQRHQRPAGTVDMSGPRGEMRWEAADPFAADLRVDGYDSKQAVLVDIRQNRTYHVFPSDFVEIVRTFGVQDENISGVFKYTNKGGKSGIAVADSHKRRRNR